MHLPVLHGLIDRRILANFRVDPEVLARILPAPFRPQIVRGWGVAGICLIRLKHVRPRWLPVPVGLASENAAHRIAVEWDENGAIQRGVYIPRRDTSSWWNAFVGGRLFPGIHHHARFDVHESLEQFSVKVACDDGTRIVVEGHVADALPSTSIFTSLHEASEFFKSGSVGYSATNIPGTYDGLELQTHDWKVVPLAIDKIESSFFQDESRFPPGSTAFDCALLMRRLEHAWHARETLHCEPCVTPA